jgi:Zn-dependent membrane protease YugP
MTIGFSILLIVAGAILRFATHFHLAHVDLHTVGLILMIAGVVGLLIGLYFEFVWSRRARREIPAEEVQPVARERDARY